MKKKFLQSLCEWLVAFVAMVVVLMLGGLFHEWGLRGIRLALLTIASAAAAIYLAALLVKKIFKLKE